MLRYLKLSTAHELAASAAAAADEKHPASATSSHDIPLLDKHHARDSPPDPVRKPSDAPTMLAPNPDTFFRNRKFRRSRFLAVLFFLFIFACLIKFSSLFVSISTAFPARRPPSPPPTLRAHPTYTPDFTAGIKPLPLHSHNDYWRTVPLFSALAVGAVSVEADVWSLNADTPTLFVGHDRMSLTRLRTLDALYIAPLVGLLDARNPGADVRARNGSWAGVFVEAPRQTLNLYVDLKTEAGPTLGLVLRALEPLRRRGYLTTYRDGRMHPGAVTVHMTGNTAFEDVLALEPRDVFFDAPLTEMGSGRYNATNSLMGTARFSRDVGKVFGFWQGYRGTVTEEMRETVRKQVKAAHERGVGVRYWDTPGWPGKVRQAVWEMLVEEGVDLLNVDDLEKAKEFY